MILVDTSVWIDHLQTSSLVLTQLLEEDRVLTHPFVLGELMLSGLVNREEILDLLEALPRAVHASHEEASQVVRRWSLDDRGVGWVDTHLLAATLLSEAQLWTHDKRLKAVSADAKIAFEERSS